MINKILHRLKLDSELERYDKIHKSIEQGIIFKGTNLWILVFAIIIASVGLNMNSTAVIIGAMLISPLMGPINGIGYSIATYNFLLFRKAVKNFTFAVVTSLAASTMYFALTPVSAAHSELLARTSPTIYDVLIALFGGLAGIIAISSKLKGNVIPGVAIATALMPPLCTAGYGLGTGQMNFFLGAIYLFTINTVFIAISSVVISQVLNFPIRTVVDEAQKTKINRWISVVIVVTLVPSIYFGYGLVQNEKFQQNASRFTENVNIVGGNYLLKSDIDPGQKTITLVYGGNSLTEEHNLSIRERLNDFSLDHARLTITQGFSFSDVMETSSEIDNLKGEINKLHSVLTEKDKQLDSIAMQIALGKQLLAEVRAMYPQIQTCTYSESIVFSQSGEQERIAIVVFTGKGRRLYNADRLKINRWLAERVNVRRIKTYYE
ncbi:MAG: DUF389 domain-containing protein [Ignavibacteriales bacterium]|nr:DUF389 domain-containing protein [Ignavibacteriales bacterium]